MSYFNGKWQTSEKSQSRFGMQTKIFKKSISYNKTQQHWRITKIMYISSPRSMTFQKSQLTAFWETPCMARVFMSYYMSSTMESLVLMSELSPLFARFIVISLAVFCETKMCSAFPESQDFDHLHMEVNKSANNCNLTAYRRGMVEKQNFDYFLTIEFNKMETVSFVVGNSLFKFTWPERSKCSGNAFRNIVKESSVNANKVSNNCNCIVQLINTGHLCRYLLLLKINGLF